MAQNFDLNANYSNNFMKNYYTSNSGSTTFNKSGNLGSLSGAIGDYNSIKNGSYKNNVNAGYNRQKTEGVRVKAGDNTSTTQKYKSVQSAASSLKRSVSELSKVSEETGRDGIYNAVSAFADSYNRTLDTFDYTNNNSLLKKGAYMTKFTAANEASLSKVGITIGDGNKLSVDKEKLLASKVSDINSLFTGHNSFGQRISERASQIEDMSKNAVNKISRMYDGAGRYAGLNAESLVNNYF
ncbi:MAG: hypothetical protein E7241_01435 [Lachnospiraceae bacterium]|jgi:hypothetical protein|nr:hypothetical protein [Lachnospiraceae bacterium]